MKRIGLLFLVLLALSACGAESSPTSSRNGVDAEQEAARLERELEQEKEELERQIKEARREARREKKLAARREAREERKREARRAARVEAREQAAEAEEQAVAAAAPESTCDYDPCLAPAADYDCAGGSGDGPAYTGPVRVIRSDPYDLDSDGDGWGCES